MSDDFENTFTKPTDGRSPPQPDLLHFDRARYAGELADLDISEDQRRELLETLWSIMHSLVELGFDVDIMNVFVSDGESGGLELGDTPKLEMPPDADGKEREDD